MKVTNELAATKSSDRAFQGSTACLILWLVEHPWVMSLISQWLGFEDSQQVNSTVGLQTYIPEMNPHELVSIPEREASSDPNRFH